MSDNALVAIMFVALMVAVCVMCVCATVASRRLDPRTRSERIVPPMWTYSGPAKEKREAGESDADA